MDPHDHASDFPSLDLYTDAPQPLREDLYVEHIYESLTTARQTVDPVYESSFFGLLPDGEGASADARQATNAAPVPLIRQFPSEALPVRRKPPPLPPRPRNFGKKTKSFDLPDHAPQLTRSNTEVGSHDPWTIRVIDTPEGSTRESALFCESTTKLMSRYKHWDQVHNSGVVRGRLFPVHPALLHQVMLNVTVVTDNDSYQLPVPTTIDLSVQTLIDQVVELLDLPPSTGGHYVLKLCNSEQYLQNDRILGSHETVQHHTKFNMVLPLRLLNINNLTRHLSRIEKDDMAVFHLYHFLRFASIFSVSKLSLNNVLACYNKEASEIVRSQSGANISALVEVVRTISNLLCGLSCQDLEDAIGGINRVNSLFLSRDEMFQCESAMLVLHMALQRVLQVFFDNIQSDFRCQTDVNVRPICDVEQNPEILQFNIASFYQLQLSWMTSYESFSVTCKVTYVRTEVCSEGVSENISTALALGNKIQCNRMMVFPVQVNKLPFETMLTFHLFGSKRGKTPDLLCWAVLPLYTNKTLVNRTILLGMSSSAMPPTPPSPALYDGLRQASGVIMQLEFRAEHQWRYLRPIALPGSVDFSPACEDAQRKILEISNHHCPGFLSPNQRKSLWDKRHCCNRDNTFLHLLLGVAPRWQPEDLTELYTVLKNWTISRPEEALFLLSDSFHDQTVRKAAVQYFEENSDEELEQFLPQLVQALKSEWELHGPLVMLLLERSMKNIRVAQQLYWLLEDVLVDHHYYGWYSKIRAALRFCCGEALREELDKQSKLVSVLVEVAETVRTADKSKRKNIMGREKSKIEDFFSSGTHCCLPLDAAVRVQGVDLQACKVYSSYTAPIGVSFICTDSLAKNVSIICKTSDDLRQDMLVLQIVRIMDRVWLQEGLDLRMVTFRCLSTGRAQGVIEVVPDAVTLANIQQEWGLEGTLRADTLKRWFSMYNRTKDDYEKAVMNFIHSCAGWCVATFILGICDRHNDNIMLKHSGHMFHIDFGKILGNAQMFVMVKRDRAPFIFTSEMLHFITAGGEKPQHFHFFVELCCEAYNIIRGRSALILSLLELMLNAGMPELKDSQDLRFVLDNLRPNNTDLEATSFFTKKIKKSMESVAVKLNFLSHSIAQGKKESKAHNGIPGPNTNIQDVTIQGCSTDKQDKWVFDLKVTIDDGFLNSQMTFEQLEQIHRQLQKRFIESTLPQFPRKLFSITKSKRMSQLNKYLKQLFEGPCKGNEYVCSLFLDGPEKEQEAAARESRPQIQLFISYADSKLSVLVKHLKDIKHTNGSNPDAYVVTRLRPDPQELSKKKTKIVRNNDNPTFNELLQYNHVPVLHGTVLEVAVKSRKSFLASTYIKLVDELLNKEAWFPLGYSDI
ncbi:phosphatidylinositol 3-kinase C2 domain-containing subunit gamma isoform 2-T3 [Synchiropus picturatus]